MVCTFCIYKVTYKMWCQIYRAKNEWVLLGKATITDNRQINCMDKGHKQCYTHKNNYTIKVKGLAFLSLERSHKTRKDTKNFVNKPGPT